MSAAPYLRRERTPLAPVTPAPEAVFASLDDAYRAINAQALARPGLWRGYKLGGTNHASRAAFGVSRGYYGGIEPGEIHHQPDRAPRYPMAEIKGEVEIALRLGPGGTGYDAWCVALEMPSSPLTNLPQAGVAALVADRCATGALVLGRVHQGALPDLGAARFALVQDGRACDSAGLDRLVDHPAALLDDFLALARGHGLRPAAGDWIATGGITACCALRDGGRVALMLDGATELAFTVDCGGQRDG